MRPVHTRGFGATRHDRTHKSRLADDDLPRVTELFELFAVSLERCCYTLYGIMKKVEIVAEANGVRFEMQRCATCEIAQIVR